jgi:hypothetical protein
MHNECGDFADALGQSLSAGRSMGCTAFLDVEKGALSTTSTGQTA